MERNLSRVGCPARAMNGASGARASAIKLPPGLIAARRTVSPSRGSPRCFPIVSNMVSYFGHGRHTGADLVYLCVQPEEHRRLLRRHCCLRIWDGSLIITIRAPQSSSGSTLAHHASTQVHDLCVALADRRSLRYPRSSRQTE